MNINQVFYKQLVNRRNFESGYFNLHYKLFLYYVIVFKYELILNLNIFSITTLFQLLMI